MRNKMIFIGFFLCIILGCSPSAVDEKVEAFNYEELLESYTQETKKGTSFSELVDMFFYDPIQLKLDTSNLSSYYFLEMSHYSYRFDLSVDGNEFIYYWEKDILETEHRDYYDTLCDCNVVIKSTKRQFYLPICFYKEKIYSMNTKGFNR